MKTTEYIFKNYNASAFINQGDPTERSNELLHLMKEHHIVDHSSNDNYRTAFSNFVSHLCFLVHVDACFYE